MKLELENSKLTLVILACLVGFFGDSLLQIGVKRFNMGTETGWGLREYFSQHGTVESLCVAAGMMAMFYIIYLFVFKQEPDYLNLAIYGIIVDLLFRQFNVFPSLKGYYSYLNYFWSAFWEAFSMVLPFFIYNQIKK